MQRTLTALRAGLGVLAGVAASWGSGGEARAAERVVVYANADGERIRQAHARLAAAFDRLGILRRHGATLRHEVVDDRDEETLREGMRRIAAMNPAVIVAPSTAHALAAKAASATIPVVFGGWQDPVAAGLIEAYARPGRNLTGFTSFLPLDEKRIELLLECEPAARRIGVIADRLWLAQPHVTGVLERSRRRFGVAVEVFEVEDLAALPGVLASARARSMGAWYVPHTRMPFDSPLAVVAAMNATGKPTIYERSQYVEAGGLVAYQSDLDDVFEVWATLVDRVLSGVQPAIIPIERPRHFQVALNLATARRLGLSIPRSVLARVDRFH